MAAAHGGGLSSTEGSHEHEMRTNHMDHAACPDRGPLEDGVSARTATQAMAATRLDGEADEHGSDAAMASGDAVRVLDQVVRDARQAAGIIAFQGAFWRVETSRQWGSCDGCEARSPEWAPCGDGIEEKRETKKPGAWWPGCIIASRSRPSPR